MGMKKAIVTGANGFVGSALCRELSAQGTEVIAVVRSRDSFLGGIETLPGVRVVCCELADISRLPQIVEVRDVGVMFHLAWTGSAGPLRADDGVQLDNVRFACDAVRACEAMGCGRFVFASSIMEYEIDAVMKSDATPGVNTIYSSAKVAADYMARTVAGAHGVAYIRAVISNIYGPGERSPRLVNTSLRKMLRGERCSFSAGEQMYDFIYIDDAAKAFAAIGDRGTANRTYYIGSLSPRPLKEFLLEMRDEVDPSLEIGLGDIPFTGVSLTYREFDIQAVKNDTGFCPETDFRTGIRQTIKWIKEKENV